VIRALGALLLLLSAASGCGPSRVGPPPASPVLTRGADAMPADLDVVFRLDLGRIKSALGPMVSTELARAARLAAQGDGSDSLVAGLLDRTDVLLVGLRPRLAANLDHVVVLEGTFDNFDPARRAAEPPWQPALDLGGDVRRWDRSEQPGRGSPARAYAWSERVVVLATPVEIDSTERAVEHGEREGALVPPSKGVVSFAARVLPLALALQESSPEIARILRSAERLEGSAELEPDGLHVDLGLKVDSAETAKHLRELMSALAQLFALRRAVAEIADSARFDVAGNYVTCRLVLPRSVMVRWMGCADGAEPCSW
jgi:hypothetical protein